MLNTLRTTNSDIEQGGYYRRLNTGSFIETAKVLQVARDRMGIPHVRFQLYVISGTEARVEQRTLALDAFYIRYKQRIYDDRG